VLQSCKAVEGLVDSMPEHLKRRTLALAIPTMSWQTKSSTGSRSSASRHGGRGPGGAVHVLRDAAMTYATVRRKTFQGQ
jgi:hypothetical protein